MPVMQDLSATGDLTFSTLKRFVKDQMADRADGKAVRRHERIVNQAINRLANRRNWAWHLRRHRIVFRPKTTYTNAVSISAETNTLKLLSGTWLMRLPLTKFPLVLPRSRITIPPFCLVIIA